MEVSILSTWKFLRIYHQAQLECQIMQKRNLLVCPWDIFMGITWNRNVLKQHLPVLYKLFAAWHLHYTVRVHPVGLSRYMFTKFQALLWSLVLSGQVLRYFTKRRAKEESILWSSCVTMTVKHNRIIHETSINTKKFWYASILKYAVGCVHTFYFVQVVVLIQPI